LVSCSAMIGSESLTELLESETLPADILPMVSTHCRRASESTPDSCLLLKASVQSAANHRAQKRKATIRETRYHPLAKRKAVKPGPA
jgi:hypothetical protein